MDINQQKIPKIIHYCWLSGDPFPQNVEKCFASWKKFLPEYELTLWDLHRFPLEKNIWVKQAFESKKYAFAADYIRLYAVYHFGGIYFDTDVEVVKNFDDLLYLPYFIGTEGYEMLEAGVFGAEKNTSWLKDCLDYYEGKTFINDDGSYNTQTLPSIMGKQISQKRNLTLFDKDLLADLDFNQKELLYVFPRDFFSAKEMGTGKILKTKNTYSIHHFAMSWIPKKDKFLSNLKRKLMQILGYDTIDILIKIFKLKEIKNKFFRK